MAKVKGFGDIGKQAGDLLGKGFDFKNTFSFATSAHDGTKINVKSIKDGEKLSGEVKFNTPMSGIPVDVTITSAAKVSMSASKSGLVDGMKATLAGSLPDLGSGKLTLDYSVPHLTTKTVIGLSTSPSVQVSAATGTKNTIIGVDTTYMTGKGLTKWAVGAGYFDSDYSAGLVLTDKGDTLKASYAAKLDSTQTAAAEIVRKLNSDKTDFTMGYSKNMDGGAKLKVKLANSGLCNVNYSFSPAAQTTLNLSGQFDTLNMDKNTKLGMGVDVHA